MNIDPTFIPKEMTRPKKAKKTKLTKSEILLLKISNHMILSGRREVPEDLVQQIEDVVEKIRLRR
jgi:hypothetical protein